MSCGPTAAGIQTAGLTLWSRCGVRCGPKENGQLAVIVLPARCCVHEAGDLQASG